MSKLLNISALVLSIASLATCEAHGNLRKLQDVDSAVRAKNLAIDEALVELLDGVVRNNEERSVPARIPTSSHNSGGTSMLSNNPHAERPVFDSEIEGGMSLANTDVYESQSVSEASSEEESYSSEEERIIAEDAAYLNNGVDPVSAKNLDIDETLLEDLTELVREDSDRKLQGVDNAVRAKNLAIDEALVALLGELISDESSSDDEPIRNNDEISVPPRIPRSSHNPGASGIMGIANDPHAEIPVFDSEIESMNPGIMTDTSTKGDAAPNNYYIGFDVVGVEGQDSSPEESSEDGYAGEPYVNYEEVPVTHTYDSNE